MSLFVPLVVFLAIVVLGGIALQNEDRDVLPSALLDRPFPEFSAPLLSDPDVIVTRDSLLGSPVLVNVWATWCPTCVAEHEMLLKIARDTNLRIVGINYKDQRGKAIDWLTRGGNPYEHVLFDGDGLLGIELGVYGAPESFLVDANGIIRYKRVGDINERIWRDEIQPRLRAMAEG